MTPKEALNNVCYGYGFDDNIVVLETALNRLEELEKVLEIIKEKKVAINVVLFCETYSEYLVFSHSLTETEFNLLKEYLK